jgi:hypothetical protein
MKSYILIILVLVGISSCGTGCVATPEPQVTNSIYSDKATLQFSVDDINYVGLASIPRKLKQVIKFSVPKNTTYAIIKTCAGAAEFDFPVGIIQYIFEPIHFIEDTEKVCLIKIGVVTMGAPLQIAVIDLFGEEVSLPSWITCNRISKRTGGSSVCQVGTGDTTRIVFDEPVVSQELKDCNKLECKDAICTFDMTKLECGYIFRGIKSGKYHRIYTRGLKPLEPKK